MAEVIKGLDEEIEIKGGIVKLWHDVVKDKKAKGESSNEKNKIPFVRLQAVIEGATSSFLSDGKISVVGTIHTPNPLKTKVITHSSASEEEMKNVNLGKGLINEQIAGNPQCKKTFTERVKTIRECLDNGMVLFAAYQTGKELNKEEMSNFNSCLKQYENLHKRELETFDSKFSGTTYIFGDKEDILVFSLSAS